MYCLVSNFINGPFTPTVRLDLSAGAYDRVAPAALLLERPGLYASSRRGLSYRTHSFWAVLLESVYVSIVMFFTATFAYWNSTADLNVYGLSCMTNCLVVMTLYVAIETRSWVS